MRGAHRQGSFHLRSFASLYPPVALALAPLLAALAPLLIPIARNFEYEYATLAAYAVLILLPLLGLIVDPRRSVRASHWALGFAAAPLFSAWPAFLAFQTQLCLCSQRDFWLWWLLQFTPHLLLAIAVFCGVLRFRADGYTRRFTGTVLLSLLALLVAQLTWMLWMLPQKRITHLIAGFIHGAIYDNWIPLDGGILLARGSHTLIALALLISVARTKRIWRLSLASGFLLSSLMLSLKATGFPSQSQGLDALIDLMPVKKSGQGFSLHFREPNSEQQRIRLEELYESTVFHMQDLSRQLEVKGGHVHIFVYPSREEKKLWFGGDGTDITDVVTPSIHINLEAWPHSTLRHELVHALASSFAFHGLGFHPNLAFTEGLAVALAPLEEELSLHAGAASLVYSGRLARPTALFSPLFWSQSGRRAYTVAGSILKFLIDRYGIAKVKQLYGGASWSDVFGEDAVVILDDWKNFLKERFPPREEAITAESLFRYPGILDDTCPHSKSLLARSSSERLTQWRQPPGWDPKKDYWPWRLSLSREPDVRLSALESELRQLWEDFTEEGARKILARIENMVLEPPRAIEDIEAFLLKVDLLVSLERHQEAEEELGRYLKVLSSYQIGDALIRQLWVRALLLGEAPREAEPWLRFIAGIESDVPAWQAGPTSWITRYLYLRNYNFGPRHQKLLEAFSRLAVPSALPDTFAVEWHRSLGMQWMRGGIYGRAAAAFLKAATLAPEGKREALALYAEEAKARDREGRSYEVRTESGSGTGKAETDSAHSR